MSEYISTKENPNGDIMPVDIGKYTNLHAHSVFRNRYIDLNMDNCTYNLAEFIIKQANKNL